MSLYNTIFGTNKASDVLLAMLGLTRKDVGRFRDCYVSNGKIAVYTRNGGGNRYCWHVDSPEYGDQTCKHHVEVREVKEILRVPNDEADNYPVVLNVFYSDNTRLVKTGKVVNENFYICEEPDSPKCGCYGCAITHRLPKHPNYLYDEDDDFDYTYATIYFSFPEEYKEALEAIDTGDAFNPNEKWLTFLDELKEGAWKTSESTPTTDG